MNLAAESTLVPPHNLTAERGVLAALILDNSKAAEVFPILTAEQFYGAEHAAIYRAMRSLHARGSALDVTLISDELRRMGEEDKDSALSDALGTVLDGQAKGANAEDYARLIQRDHRRRSVITGTAQIQALAVNGTGDLAVVRAIDELRETATPETQAEVSVMDLAHIFTDPVPETPWIAPGWLAEGDRIVFGGQRKLGKSTALTDLALALATGRSWLGFPTKPQRIAYADEEQSERLARQRIKRNMIGRGFTEDEIALASANLRYLHRNRLNLDHPAKLELLEREMTEHQADWLFFDALKRAHGRDENSNSEMSAFFANVLDPLLERTGAGLVVLAHLRKGDADEESIVDSIRGAGDIVAFVDSVWGLVKDGESRKLVCALSRWDDTAEPVFVHKEERDEDGFMLVGKPVKEAAEDTIRNTLQAAGRTGVLRPAIIETLQDKHEISLNSAKKNTTRVLSRMYHGGEVARQKEGKEARYWIRALAPEGAARVS